MNKKFYYCLSNDYSFMELPELNEQHVSFINGDKSFFTGEPDRLLIQPKEGEEGANPEENANPEGEEGKEGNEDSHSSEEEIVIPPKPLTEKDRVKFVVCAIENDCQIAPVGAFKMTA